MALFSLQREPEKAEQLASALQQALKNVKFCSKCRNLSELDICPICSNVRRDPSLLCVVETTEDLVAVESSNAFSGTYFVLHGLLSPIDGIGPKELHIDDLLVQVRQKQIKEVILATNPTVEGNTTAQFITELLPDSVKISRIAHGVPVGGELGYVSSPTIAHAIDGRTQVDEN